MKKAILRCGVPEKLYVDNGSVYRAAHLAREELAKTLGGLTYANLSVGELKHTAGEAQ